jgi:hypothetical protein
MIREGNFTCRIKRGHKKPNVVQRSAFVEEVRLWEGRLPVIYSNELYRMGKKIARAEARAIFLL